MTRPDYTARQIALFDGVMVLLGQGRRVHDLKVADITDAAGMGKSTAYEYFSSKEAIIREALAYHLNQSVQQLGRAVFAQTEFPAMLAGALDHLEACLNHRSTTIFQLLLLEGGESGRPPLMDHRIHRDLAKQMDQQIHHLMITGQGQGLISPNLTLAETRMILFGFTTAYLQELGQLIPQACPSLPADAEPADPAGGILELKQRTLKLLLKALG